MRLLSAFTGMLLAAGASGFMTHVALRPLSELRAGRQVRASINTVTYARLLHYEYVLPGKIECLSRITHLIMSSDILITNQFGVVVIGTLHNML